MLKWTNHCMCSAPLFFRSTPILLSTPIVYFTTECQQHFKIWWRIHRSLTRSPHVRSLEWNYQLCRTLMFCLCLNKLLNGDLRRIRAHVRSLEWNDKGAEYVPWCNHFSVDMIITDEYHAWAAMSRTGNAWMVIARVSYVPGALVRVRNVL